MTYSRALGLLLLIAVPVLLAQEAAIVQPSVSLPPELARVLTGYEKAWQARDAEALGRLFVEDGFVLSPGRPAVRGRASIVKYYQGHGGPLFLRAIAHAVGGNAGFIIGGYTDRTGAPDIGKFTLTLRKDDAGRWWIVSDMDNGNSRPPR